MTVWETLDASPGLSSYEMEFAKLWRAADKIVYSRTLAAVSPRESPYYLRYLTAAREG